LRRFARSIGEIGRSTRSVETGRFPLLNFVLQSLKTVPEQEVQQKTNKARRTAAFFARRCFCHLLFRSLHDISALTPNILQKTLTVIVMKKRAKQTTRKKNRRPGRATTTRTKTERTTTTTPCQQQHKRRSRRSRRRPPSPLHLPKRSQQQKRIWLTPLLRASLTSLLGARSGPSRPPIHSSLEDSSRRLKAALFSIFVSLIVYFGCPLS
jgi:hypothetical protein